MQALEGEFYSIVDGEKKNTTTPLLYYICASFWHGVPNLVPLFQRIQKGRPMVVSLFRKVRRISVFFTNKGQLGCVDIVEHFHLYLVENYINNNKTTLTNSK